MQSHLRSWLSFIINTHVQSVNNTLLSLGASDAADAFNQALASQYSNSDESFNGDELKQSLGRVREQHNRRGHQSHTNMYPIS
jgi:hypothetical protein